MAMGSGLLSTTAIDSIVCGTVMQGRSQDIFEGVRMECLKGKASVLPLNHV